MISSTLADFVRDFNGDLKMRFAIFSSFGSGLERERWMGKRSTRDHSLVPNRDSGPPLTIKVQFTTRIRNKFLAIFYFYAFILTGNTFVML